MITLDSLKKSPKKSAVAAGLLIILLLTPICYFSCDIYEEKLIDSQKERFHHDFSLYSNSFTYSLNQRISLIEALYSFVVIKTDKDRLDKEFYPFASSLYSEYHEIRSIIIAPDGVSSYVYPDFKNKDILGYNYLNDTTPSIVRQNEYLLGGKPFVLRGPAEIAPGGEGVAITKAIFLNGTFKDGDFWGFVSIIIDMPEMYRQAGLYDLSGYSVALKNTDYDVFYGNKSVFDSDPALYDMKIGNEVWTFAIVPEGGWSSFVESQLSLFKTVVLLLVIIAGFMGGYTVYSHLWLNLAVIERTRDLEKAQHELRFRNMAIETSVSPAVISDKDGLIAYMNEAAQNLWNLDETSAKEVEMVRLFTRPELIHSFLNDNSCNENLTGEFECRRSDGTIFYAHGSISAVTDENGSFQGIYGSFIDMTAEKESRIREARALKNIEENLVRLAALNDEIRNPLAVIVGYASLQGDENSEKIISQAKIIDQLINRLDKRWLESEKIREYLRKYHGIEKEDE